MRNKIKLKLVFLYYDYLLARRIRLAKKLFKLDLSVDKLEVKYMYKEPTKVDWSNLEEIKHEENINLDYK